MAATYELVLIYAGYHIGMPHPSEHTAASRPLDPGEAEQLVETLKALAAPSRLRLLVALQESGHTVEELAAAAGLTPSATSHNLRVLRTMRLVQARRDGRHVRYALHDQHVAELLAAVRHHHEHLYPADRFLFPDAEQVVQ